MARSKVFSDEKRRLQAQIKLRWPEVYVVGVVVISNFKSNLLGTYHGVSGRYAQENLDEFCYRLNRRFRPPPTLC